MSDFHKRRDELYAEFPQDATVYESEFRELQARLATAEAIIQEIVRTAREDRSGSLWPAFLEGLCRDFIPADQPSDDELPECNCPPETCWQVRNHRCRTDKGTAESESDAR